MIATFLALTVTFSVVFDGLIIESGSVNGGAGRYVTGAMWGPGFAALLTCRLYSIPVATLGWKWGETRFQVSSYLLPLAYALVAYSLIWTTGLGSVAGVPQRQRRRHRHSLDANVGRRGADDRVTSALRLHQVVRKRAR